MPSLILAGFYSIFEINQLNIRTLYALFSILTMILMYFLAKILFRNQTLALLSAVLFLSSPWSFELYRFASDTPFSLLFYLAGMVVFLKNSSLKGFLVSLSLFILGFFSYQGAKIVFLPLIALLIYFAARNKFKLYLTICAAFFVIYLLIDFLLPGKFASGRLQEFFLLNPASLSALVDKEREVAITSPFNFFYSNKAVVGTKTFIDKYLTAFSPEVLFISGDPRATYRFENHGLLNYYELIFLPLGFLSLFIKYRKISFFIISLLLISPLPTALNAVETSVINRSFMLIPALTLISALGAYSLLNLAYKYTGAFISNSLVLIVILITFSNFLYFYFYRLPVLSSEINFFSQELISRYISYHQQISDKPIDIFLSKPQAGLNSAVFYNFSTLSKDFFKTKAELYDRGIYQVNNITFHSECPKKLPDGVILIESSLQCPLFDKKENSLFIKDIKDANDIYQIYNDQLCQGQIKDTYRRFHLIEDYSIKSMSQEKFCQRWIFKSG